MPKAQVHMFHLCINSISCQLELLRFTLSLTVESRDAPSPKQNCFELTLGLKQDGWPWFGSAKFAVIGRYLLPTAILDSAVLTA